MEPVAVLLIVLLVTLLLMACGAAMYIFEALGMYTIAKRRGIKNPWMAWVPYANYWLLGCVSDQYRQVVHGQSCNRRKKLLILGIVSTAIGMLYSSLSSMRMGLDVGAAMFGGAPADRLSSFIFILQSVSLIPMLVMGIILTVNMYICWFDVYRSCAPEKTVKYLVLSILFSFLYPFFIFRIRNRDDGMIPAAQVWTEDRPEL